MFLSFLFEIVVDIVNESVRKGVLSRLLYADHLVLMSETIKVVRNKFNKWR